MSIINIKKTLQTFCHCIFFKKENIGVSRCQKFSRARKNNQSAFTLIEMMVAVSIFAIVVMIAMTAILSVVDSTKKAQSLKSVMNNLNFALETMTRTVKSGNKLTVNGGANGSTQSISSTENDKIIKYSLGTIDKTSLVRTVNGGDEEPITAPEVNITNLKFINGKDMGGGSHVQPSVVMIIQGTVKIGLNISSDFNVQTTITQRSMGS